MKALCFVWVVCLTFDAAPCVAQAKSESREVTFHSMHSMVLDSTAAIVGVVHDSLNHSLAGTNIALFDASTKALMTGTSVQPKNNYEVFRIRPGEYNIRVTLIGYHTLSLDNFRLNANTLAIIDFYLRPVKINLHEVK